MLEFNIASVDYRAVKIPAMTQNDLVRKLTPVLPNLVPLFAAFFKMRETLAPDDTPDQVAEAEEKTSPAGDVVVPDTKPFDEGAILDKLAGLASSFSPLADALASMSKENSDFIIYTCLSSVSMKNGNDWAKLCRGEQIMFDDLELATIYQIVLKVLRYNLGNFITGLVTAAKAAASPTL